MIKMKEKITKKMVLGEVITKYPQTMEIFFKYGLPCAMCHLASDETLEQAAEAHEVELSKLLKDLNKVVMKK
jgi:hybrid cluster-associated redox disulfide protein